MSQNPQDSQESEATAVSEALAPESAEGRRRSRAQSSSVLTSKLEALTPASGPARGFPRREAEGETEGPPPRTQALRPRRRPGAEMTTARRRVRRQKHPRPSFRGPRLADSIGWWRRLRSVVFLVVITVILGMILAAIVAVAVGAVVVAIQHALKSG